MADVRVSSTEKARNRLPQAPVDKIVEGVAYVIVSLIVLIMVYPVLNVIAVSVSSYASYVLNPTMIIPDFRNLTLRGFQSVLEYSLITTSYRNTIIVTLAGTVFSLLLTICTAYPLSKRELVGQKPLVSFVIFTMMFNGGMIPNFYLMRSLGLLDSLWALILPGMISAFNVILMKNFFSGIPPALEEAALIDGANDIQVLFKVVLPLSMPIIASITLFVSVGYWNNYFNAVIYISSRNWWPLQLVMREIIYSASASMQSGGDALEVGSKVPSVTLQYCTMIVAILPIMVVYPFLQKYFAKGVMIGAVKG